MKSIYIILIIGTITACGGDTLEDKKKQLDQLKAEVTQLNRQIQQLESDIVQSDPDYQPLGNQHTLISTYKVTPGPFEHRFEVRASVASRKNVLISAETSGRIEQIHVNEGEQVKKGELLITLDASILENSIEELETQLDLATTLYEKRARLWQQNIGSEIQYLEAKNQKETLQRKLETTYSQLSQSRIRAPFNGVVDNIDAKLGEMAMVGAPMIRILSVDEMHLEADVSENYLGRLQKGDSVDLIFSSFDVEIRSVITSVGQVINPQNRTFSVEIALPASKIPYKPNLVAVVRIRDYYQKDALVIPSELIQRDNQGYYVYAIQDDTDEMKATKVHIVSGRSYQSKTEVIGGLEPGAVLISGGHREVTDGALVQVAEREL